MAKDRELTRRELMKLASAGIAATVVRPRAFGVMPGLPGAAANRLVEAFMHPAAEARPWCYWYWMNGNVTRAGIQADLQGLADVGIGGVNYFDIGLLPAGEVVNRSPEWYELVKFAFSEAARHNIKVSVNCAGWSGTGGAWITPELAMQELTWNETAAEGGREFSARLLQPPTRLGFYRDIAVLAFPTPRDDEPLPLPVVMDTNGYALPQAAAAMQSTGVLPARTFSQSPGTAEAAPAGSDLPTDLPMDLPVSFDCVFPHAVEVRSLFVRVARESHSFRAALFAWDDSLRDFRLVGRFHANGVGPFSSTVGAGSFAAVRATKFRVVFENRKEGERIFIEQLRFSGGFRVTDWTIKDGFSGEPVKPLASDLVPQAADVISLEHVINISDKVGPDGVLKWTIPEGNWTILRMGHTPTGIRLFPTPKGGAGLDCDKLSAHAADFHYDHCVKTLIGELGPELSKKALAYYHSDSYESGWQNWTAKFPQDFHERRGYDLVQYLPAVTGRAVGSIETTERFLWDFRRTIGDLFADNNYGRLAQRCHEDGIGFSTEPYGGPFEQLQVGMRADRPMTEVWLPGAAQGAKLWPQAVFAGRTDGRKIQGAESFTSDPPAGGKWNTHPFFLKPLGDLIFCSGVNQYCIHVSTQQPLLGEHMRPGFTCGQNGIHFDRGNTWWRHGAKEWLEYVTRCQAMLQEGEQVADVLYFQGNDSPAGVGPFEPGLPDGYDFDDCNGEVLSVARVSKGLVVLPSGKSYRYLVLPGHGRVTLASLRKIAALVHDGAVVVGTVPRESPSLADASGEAEYRRLVMDLAARVRTGQSFREILAADRLGPDFSYDEKAGLVVHYTHRRLGDVDYYFVASASPHAGTVECRFRVAGKVPELWRPDSGVTEACALYEESDDTVRIPLDFDPSGSMFVVFRHGSAKVHATAISLLDRSASITAPQAIPLLLSDGSRLKLSAWQPGTYEITMASQQRHRVEIAAPPAAQVVKSAWTVEFPAGWGAPERITLEKLVSWPEYSDAGVRYFSGTATYRTTVQAAKASSDCRVFLDLGRVEVIAETWLNGKALGALWKPPFLCDVTALLRSGANELEVRVTNLWPNRLIGDEQFPDDCTPDGRWARGVMPVMPEWLKQGTRRPESRRLTFCTWKHWRKDDALLASGLLGPVTLRQVRVATLTGS
jgi:hypothetical protein